VNVLLLLQGMADTGDSQRLEHAYFWTGVSLAFVPILIFGTIGFLVVRSYRRRKAATPPPGEAGSGPR